MNLVLDFINDLLNELIKTHNCCVFLTVKSVGNCSVILLVETNNKKIWYLLDLSFTHTIAQFLIII